MSRHIFLDLETLGNGETPDPAIVQIGLVVFDAGRIVQAAGWDVDYAADIAAGACVDGSTIKWWAMPERNRASLLADNQLHPAEAIRTAIDTGRPWEPVGWWANGPDDWTWIKSMWKRYNSGIPFPLPYNAFRDLRTFRKTVGRDITIPRDKATMHDALQDALWGARWLQEAHRKLGNVL